MVSVDKADVTPVRGKIQDLGDEERAKADGTNQHNESIVSGEMTSNVGKRF